MPPEMGLLVQSVYVCVRNFNGCRHTPSTEAELLPSPQYFLEKGRKSFPLCGLHGLCRTCSPLPKLCDGCGQQVNDCVRPCSYKTLFANTDGVVVCQLLAESLFLQFHQEKLSDLEHVFRFPLPRGWGLCFVPLPCVPVFLGPWHVLSDQ